MPFILATIFGILAGCFALLIELAVLNVSTLGNSAAVFSLQIFGTLLLLALIEEISKFIFLFRYQKYAPIEKRPTLVSLIALAILFGTGFASLELVLSLQDGSTFHFFSFFRTLLLHIATTVFLAYFLYFRPEQKDATSFFSLRNLWIVFGAVLIHLVYNIVLFLMT